MTSPAGASLVRIARAAGSFGVKGEVRIRAYGDDPTALLAYKVLRDADGRAVLTLVSGRAAKGELIAVAEEIRVKEAADALRGVELFVERAVLPPPDEDEYYLVDLIGLRVEATDGTPLGRVKAIHNFGAGDILEVAQDSGVGFFLPFTKAAVPEVRILEGRLVADPPVDVEGEPEGG